jgi:hypothetical protein
MAAAPDHPFLQFSDLGLGQDIFYLSSSLSWLGSIRLINFSLLPPNFVESLGNELSEGIANILEKVQAKHLCWLSQQGMVLVKMLLSEPCASGDRDRNDDDTEPRDVTSKQA